MLVEIYDIDDATNLNNLKAQEFIGSFKFTLGKVVTRKELPGEI
jgi:hypothetical protein